MGGRLAFESDRLKCFDPPVQAYGLLQGNKNPPNPGQLNFYSKVPSKHPNSFKNVVTN